MPEQTKRRGNRLGIWFFKTTMRLAGLRGAYALLYPVCFWYACFDRAAVRSALPYISRRFPKLRATRRWWAPAATWSSGRRACWGCST